MRFSMAELSSVATGAADTEIAKKTAKMVILENSILDIVALKSVLVESVMSKRCGRREKSCLRIIGY